MGEAQIGQQLGSMAFQQKASKKIMPKLLWSLKGNIRNENKMGKAFGVIGSSFNFEHREKIETWGIGDALTTNRQYLNSMSSI